MSDKTPSHPKQSTLKTLSYSTGIGLNNLSTSAVSTLLLLYYTGVTGINVWWYALAQTLYAIFNAINDPLIGFITDRNYPKLLKFGKRFPWIIVGILGISVSMLLIYNVPESFYGKDVLLFFWMLVSLCLFDLFYSLYFVNHMALGPVFFRSNDERRKLGTFNTIMATVMLIFGMVIPVLLVDKKDPGTYGQFIFICGILTLIVGALVLPGVKENKETTQMLIKAKDNEKEENFFKILWESLKHKNFLLVISVSLFFAVFTNTAIASMPFFVMNVLGYESEDPMLYMILVEFAFIFISLPFWNKIIKKIGFNKTFVISGLFVSIASLLLLFARDLVQSVVIFGLLGCAVAGFMAMEMPLFNNVLDEMAVKHGSRREGVYSGIRVFFTRFAFVFQSLIIAIVRSITKFDPMIPATFTKAALFGIRIEMIGVGSILMAISVFIFKKYFDLDEKKMETVREKLNTLDEAQTVLE